VLAEGVETAGELKFLVDELCDEAQGYHLGMPAQIEEYRHLTHDIAVADEPSRVTYLGTEKRLKIIAQ
jgi:EAL domain-containing protein (putative c-di-GMP-specific phosphodiesterase class I)